MALLELDNLQVFYGHIHALKGISLTVDQGEVVALLGSNGAGKTTTLRTISGLMRPRQGRVLLEGETIDHLPPHVIVNRGIGHAPEGRRIFARLTVRENLEMGAYAVKDRAQVEEDLARVFALFPILDERKAQRAMTLSGGERQMLAIGRALMARPRVLLLDEPTAALAPRMVEELFRRIAQIRDAGVPILLVEQHAKRALEVADRGYVLVAGEKAMEGRGAEILANEDLKSIFLGRK